MGRLALKNILKDKAEQIASATAVIVKHKNDFQTLKKYITNRLSNIKLTADQDKMLKRYQFIYSELMGSKYSEAEIVSMLVSLHNIDESTAYRSITETKDLFSEVIHIDKRFELKVELESFREMKRKCLAIGDLDTANKIGKNIVRILALLEDKEQIPADMFEGHTIEPAFDPSLIGAPKITKESFLDLMKAIAEKRGKQFNITDIPFEDVKPND